MLLNLPNESFEDFMFLKAPICKLEITWTKKAKTPKLASTSALYRLGYFFGKIISFICISGIIIPVFLVLGWKSKLACFFKNHLMNYFKGFSG